MTGLRDHKAGSITVIVRAETFGQSIANDCATVLILCGLVAVNEVTIASPTLNFLFGLLGFFFLLGWTLRKGGTTTIRTTSPDEAVAFLKRQIAFLSPNGGQTEGGKRNA